ncbi:MAG TPA: PEP/pyruvate-binding domain-containing protein [bacterium]|nr:PEP/pyruvate-binding domain-containing protein [bacterium]
MKYDAQIQHLIDSLKERAKELSTLYEVQEILHNKDLPLDDIFNRIIDAIPHGFLYPEFCQAKIAYENLLFITPDFTEAQQQMRVDIVVEKDTVGYLEVSYRENLPPLDEGPFLKEERRLINTIARSLSQTLLHRQLDALFHVVDLQSVQKDSTEPRGADLHIVLEMLRLTDPALLLKISRRMLNYLCYIGVEEAKELLGRIGGRADLLVRDQQHEGVNRPIKHEKMTMSLELSDQILNIASKHISNKQIVAYFQKWINDSKVGFLLNVLEDSTSSLSDIIEAIARYKDAGLKDSELSPSTVNAVKVSLIRRFFSRRLDFINLAKRYVTIEDFYDLTRHLVYPENSNGRLGGKAAGLFMALRIVRQVAAHHELLKEIKVPKTWYLASDGIIDFIHHNHLEEMLDYKYHDMDQIRIEYPNLIQLFKNSSFSPAMVHALSAALDDFGDRPLIVRSSSLLEDGEGHAFSGKYKSLFIANQGGKSERLAELLDAIAEVYASTFGPDPIEYRAEHGLLDFPEEMGIIIQEVVGNKVGSYLCPAYAGVGFSHNEFRWSSRIKREDGLARLVPGLGTRAVDRLSNDYPVLVAPGQPGLRVNPSLDEKIRYAPKYIDVINLETKSIETVKLEELIKQYGHEFPNFRRVFSTVKDNFLQPAGGLIDYEHGFHIATFDGLLTQTDFIKRIKTLMDVLKDSFLHPVDIEFAADRENFFLLQCRVQSSAHDRKTVAIPRDVPAERIVFTANKYISDGFVNNVTHVVYVTPEGYDKIINLEELKSIGRVVGKLNSILPQHQFVLIGPGRWGSRGDIKLGVEVTYSDINNTAALIEVAFKKGDYLPDLSFGTHFFQDLVEANIAYLPLYPDDPRIVFNHEFLTGSPNLLGELLPDYKHLDEVIRVIEVPAVADGRILQILMNADDERAIAMFALPEAKVDVIHDEPRDEQGLVDRNQYWMWRLRMAEKLALALDAERFGVKSIYVMGSTKNATAGPCSDIDLLLHIDGDERQKADLELWLNAWSISLGEMNYLRTGYETKELLDVHYVTDEDLRLKTSFAVKINAVNDALRPLPMKSKEKKN